MVTISAAMFSYYECLIRPKDVALITVQQTTHHVCRKTDNYPVMLSQEVRGHYCDKYSESTLSAGGPHRPLRSHSPFYPSFLSAISAVSAPVMPFTTVVMPSVPVTAPTPVTSFISPETASKRYKHRHQYHQHNNSLHLLLLNVSFVARQADYLTQPRRLRRDFRIKCPSGTATASGQEDAKTTP
jgi:hypothetical protein